jgi:CheY-like chemotaxis protein
MTHGNFPLAYFHPTEVVVVDDQSATLDAIRRLMPPRMLFRGFTDPEVAYGHIDEKLRARPSLVERSVRLHRSQDADALVHVDFNQIEREITNSNRFSLPTVLVTDYLMQTMSGIELCRRLKHHGIKKVLLTGVADESTAVAAFNDGLLDRFVLKSSPDALERAVSYASELQRMWFSEQQNAFLRSPAIAAVFANKDVMAHVHALLERGGFVEYYVTIGPLGYMALDMEGNATRILLIDDEDRATQFAYARQHGAPQDVLDELGPGTSIAYFFEDAGDFDSGEYPWHSLLAPATRVDADGASWFIGALPCPPMDVDFDADVSSLAAVLKRP